MLICRKYGFHPGRFSRPNWIKCQATWSDPIAHPAVSRRLDYRPPELPSSLNYPAVPNGSYQGSCILRRRPLEVISGVVPGRTLASCSEAIKLVLAMGILSLASVRGPAPREQCCPKSCVPVPLPCCDSDASGNQSCGRVYRAACSVLPSSS